MTTPEETTSTIHQNNNINTEEGELVSEFPPPPYYYTQITSTTNPLIPPPIPYEAIQRASIKAVEEMKKKKEEAERMRISVENDGGENGIGFGGGMIGSTSGEFLGGDAPDFEKSGVGNEDNDKVDEVAVFGEYVEDPLVAPVNECDNPKVVKDEIFRLNKEIIQGFVKLVRNLVDSPVEHKKSRDVLSHNIFLMLQECNKFREHQAREILIETLETQLRDRQKALEVLQDQIEKTDEAIADFSRISKASEQR